ncbi:MAG: hydrogenase assembly protein HupF [Nonomuraea sp.]|nr:hydrogenase assembly protein HupF [Nonomuraea sp.]NUP65176.1 hydrogenase assembly protein HupF [Nonomuraea sp.]NUP81209.1 hydrogenase assembly protein HupF [Nonomuraea sp.]NUS03671.1 hydrogenase assembly protein HupF [Nonomuraea sp.]
MSGCHDPRTCLTCADAAVIVTVVRLLGDGLALVDTGQAEEEVSVAGVTAGPGDTLLVQAGEAIAVLGAKGDVTATPSGEDA